MEPTSRAAEKLLAHPHFVTMRLPDALPYAAMQAWHDDVDRRVQRVRGIKGRALEHDEERILVQRTLGRLERVLDAGKGTCVLSDERAAGLVESVLWNGDGEQYRLHAWSVMPNHVHALVTPASPEAMEPMLQDWRNESTRRVNQELRRTGNLWHANVIDYEVELYADFVRLRKTIAQNPLQAGLHEWPFAGEESRSRSTPAALVSML